MLRRIYSPVETNRDDRERLFTQRFPGNVHFFGYVPGNHRAHVVAARINQADHQGLALQGLELEGLSGCIAKGVIANEYAENSLAGRQGCFAIELGLCCARRGHPEKDERAERREGTHVCLLSR